MGTAGRPDLVLDVQQQLARCLVTDQEEGGLSEDAVAAFLALYDQIPATEGFTEQGARARLKEGVRSLARDIEDGLAAGPQRVSVSVEELRFRPCDVACAAPCLLTFTLSARATAQRIQLVDVTACGGGGADDGGGGGGGDCGVEGLPGARVLDVSPELRPGGAHTFRISSPGSYVFASEVFTFMTGRVTAAPPRAAPGAPPAAGGQQAKAPPGSARSEGGCCPDQDELHAPRDVAAEEAAAGTPGPRLSVSSAQSHRLSEDAVCELLSQQQHPAPPRPALAPVPAADEGEGEYSDDFEGEEDDEEEGGGGAAPWAQPARRHAAGGEEEGGGASGDDDDSVCAYSSSGSGAGSGAGGSLSPVSSDAPPPGECERPALGPPSPPLAGVGVGVGAAGGGLQALAEAAEVAGHAAVAALAPPQPPRASSFALGLEGIARSFDAAQLGRGAVGDARAALSAGACASDSEEDGGSEEEEGGAFGEGSLAAGLARAAAERRADPRTAGYSPIPSDDDAGAAPGAGEPATPGGRRPALFDELRGPAPRAARRSPGVGGASAWGPPLRVVINGGAGPGPAGAGARPVTDSSCQTEGPGARVFGAPGAAPAAPQPRGAGVATRSQHTSTGHAPISPDKLPLVRRQPAAPAGRPLGPGTYHLGAAFGALRAFGAPGDSDDGADDGAVAMDVDSGSGSGAEEGPLARGGGARLGYGFTAAAALGGGGAAERAGRRMCRGGADLPSAGAALAARAGALEAQAQQLSSDEAREAQLRRRLAAGSPELGLGGMRGAGLGGGAPGGIVQCGWVTGPAAAAGGGGASHAPPLGAGLAPRPGVLQAQGLRPAGDAAAALAAKRKPTVAVPEPAAARAAGKPRAPLRAPGGQQKAAAAAAGAEAAREREKLKSRLLEAEIDSPDQEDAPRPASPPLFACVKCRRAYSCRFNLWRCKETHQLQPGGAARGGRQDGGAAAKEGSAASYARDFRAFAASLPPRRLAAILDVTNTLEGALALLAAAHLRTQPPAAGERAGAHWAPAPLWRAFSPCDAESGPSEAAAARGRRRERRRLLGAASDGDDSDEEDDAARRAEMLQAAAPGAWGLLPDLLALAMPFDGAGGAGAFWRGAGYDGTGTADDDDANVGFQEADELLSQLADAQDTAAAAERELRAADAELGRLAAAEAATRERAGLQPRPAAAAERDTDADADAGDVERGEVRSGLEGAVDAALAETLPLGLRTQLRAARDRAAGAAARMRRARGAFAEAAAAMQEAEDALDAKAEELMVSAAEAAPAHPIGPATLAPWLLAPLDACPRAAAAGAPLRQLADRLQLAPAAAPDAARCFWRLWRGKWARLRERFGGAPRRPALGLGGAAELDVDRILSVLQVGAGRMARERGRRAWRRRRREDV
ncbi:MAG: hypothetical protein J3K34DRAFT_457960 [Monoraphidium minutum]|nr:MAG: hypothetical protein J3K34DRAFT_457960 [Monoraphidium minutum]